MGFDLLIPDYCLSFDFIFFQQQQNGDVFEILTLKSCQTVNDVLFVYVGLLRSFTAILHYKILPDFVPVIAQWDI